MFQKVDMTTLQFVTGYILIRPLGLTCFAPFEANASDTNLTIFFSSVHEGIREHQCPDCGKFFQSSTVLNKHIRNLHTRIDDWMDCEHCDKKFRSVNALHSHLRTLHELFVAWTPAELAT